MAKTEPDGIKGGPKLNRRFSPIGPIRNADFGPKLKRRFSSKTITLWESLVWRGGSVGKKLAALFLGAHQVGPFFLFKLNRASLRYNLSPLRCVSPIAPSFVFGSKFTQKKGINS